MSAFIDELARIITNSIDDAEATRQDWLRAIGQAFDVPTREPRLERNGVTVQIVTTAGSDGATIVMIDTDPEPNGSDDILKLRVVVNNTDITACSPADFVQSKDATEAETLSSSAS